MLVDAGLLTEEQLDLALKGLKKTELRLGQYLVIQGLVSEQQIVDFLSKQLKIDIFETDSYSIDPGLATSFRQTSRSSVNVCPSTERGACSQSLRPIP